MTPPIVESASHHDGWVVVGVMCGASLAAQYGITPLDDDYISTLEVIEDEGGLRPEFNGRVVYVYARQVDIARASVEGQ